MSKKKPNLRRLAFAAEMRVQHRVSKDIEALQKARDGAMARVAELDAAEEQIAEARAWNARMESAGALLQSKIDETSKIASALLTRVEAFRGDLSVLVRSLEQVAEDSDKHLADMRLLVETKPALVTPDTTRAGLGMAFATIKAERDAAVRAHQDLAGILEKSASTVILARKIVSSVRGAATPPAPAVSEEAAPDTTHVAEEAAPDTTHAAEEAVSYTTEIGLYRNRKNPDRCCLATVPDDRDLPVAFTECDVEGRANGKQGEAASAVAFLKSWGKVR